MNKKTPNPNQIFFAITLILIAVACSILQADNVTFKTPAFEIRTEKSK